MIQEKHLEKRVYAFDIRTDFLVKATRLMNHSRSEHFESRVVEIITGFDSSIIIVETYGTSGYTFNKWMEELCSVDEREYNKIVL